MGMFSDAIRRIAETAAEDAIKDALSKDKISASLERAIHNAICRVYDNTSDGTILSRTGFRMFLAIAIRRSWPDYPEKSLRADIGYLMEGMDDADAWDWSAGAARDLAREHIAEFSE